MASQIDIHVAKRQIYWSDHGNKATDGTGIHRRGTDGAGYQRIISTGIGAKGIKGLAVDWIAGKITIEKINGLHERTCFLARLHEVQKSYCSHPGRTRSHSRYRSHSCHTLLEFSRSLYLDNQLSESIYTWTIGTL